MTTSYGMIIETESTNRSYSGRCQVCDFVTTKALQVDAEKNLREHLLDYHRVTPRIVVRAPFVPVGNSAPEKGQESS